MLGIAFSFLAVAFLAGGSGLASAAPSQGASGTSGSALYATVPNPTAVAVTPTQLMVLSGCSAVYSIASPGAAPVLVATLTGAPNKCPEGAIAISPGLGNYPAGQAYVLVGSSLYTIPAGTVNGARTGIAVPSNLSGTYAGLTFDYFGAFGYGLLATGGHNGNIYLISPGSPPAFTWLGSIGTYVEGPTVTPSNFGATVDGTLLMAAEGKSTFYSFAPSGGVQTFGSWKDSEAVSVVPQLACSYTGYSYFVVDNADNALLGFSQATLQAASSSSIAGQALVLSEYKGVGVGLMNPTTGATSSLIPLSGTLEAAAYVTCAVGVTQTFDPATAPSGNSALTSPDLIGYDPVNGQLVGADPGAPNQVFFVYCAAQGCAYKGAAPAGTDPAAVTYAPKDNALYVANNGSDSITVLDATNPTTAPAPVAPIANGAPQDAIVYSPTNSKLYVASYSSPTISVYSVPDNLFSNSLVSLQPAGHPYGMVYDPVGNDVYVVGNSGGTGIVWQIHAFEVVASLSFSAATLGGASGSNATAIAVDSSTGLLYVTLSAANRVAIIAPGNSSASTPPTLVGTVAVGTDPTGIAYNAANGLVFVSNYEDGTIGIIQGQTQVATIPLGPGADPGMLVYDPVTQYVYVAANYAVPDPRIILGTG